MATSAIGPGFLTQTTVFTGQLGARFAFVILLSFFLDLVVQINIWRMVTASGQNAAALVSRVWAGAGLLLTLLIALGGLAFNIGNIAGAGLGIGVMTGWPASVGAILSALLALALFFRRSAFTAMDFFARFLGLLMIGLMAWVAVAARPPLTEVGVHLLWPEQFDAVATLTIVGGTVGGYISFAGAHRLLEAGWRGPDYVSEATRSAIQGIGVATLMRVLLFLAAFGVVSAGHVFDPANPPASLFAAAAGEAGRFFFGMVMWAASITSVVGATFTSLTFVQASFPMIERHRATFISAFVGFSLLFFLFWGKPVALLLLAGTINGFILPVALALMLFVARRPDYLGGYRLPLWGQVGGWAAVLLLLGMAIGWLN
jgi:Mn2+/Fe2+ NRAMP family transporter